VNWWGKGLRQRDSPQDYFCAGMHIHHCSALYLVPSEEQVWSSLVKVGYFDWKLPFTPLTHHYNLYFKFLFSFTPMGFLRWSWVFTCIKWSLRHNPLTVFMSVIPCRLVRGGLAAPSPLSFHKGLCWGGCCHPSGPLFLRHCPFTFWRRLFYSNKLLFNYFASPSAWNLLSWDTRIEIAALT
jgi:hypothetical protein